MENSVESVQEQQTDRRELSFTYPYYKDMSDNNIIFSYKGLVNSDLVTHVLEIMEDRLEDDRQNRKLSKKVFNVMVECLTNVYADDDKKTGKSAFDPTAILTVRKLDDTYCVTTGSYIQHNAVHKIKKLIDKINKMTVEELKVYYQEVLLREDPSLTGLTGLGIIDLARKSRNKLEYTFNYANENYTFFSLEARISPNNV